MQVCRKMHSRVTPRPDRRSDNKIAIDPTVVIHLITGGVRE